MSPHQRRTGALLQPAGRAAATSIALVGLLGLASLPSSPVTAAAGRPVTLVICAPGYPGSTAEAQPAMDTLAATVAAASGWAAGELAAVYFETEQGGLDRLGAADAAVAAVPLPFWLEHRGALKLEPFLQAVQQGGAAAEPWSLVAGAGLITGASGLAGFDIVSLAGYSSRFVRGPALGAWGEVPQGATVSFSAAVLTGLRRASSGSKVALLLDREQAAALPTLPFAAKLEVVTRSAPLPVSVVCLVRGRLPAARLKALSKGLLSLDGTAAGAEALAGVRLERFVDADGAALARAVDAYSRVRE